LLTSRSAMFALLFCAALPLSYAADATKSPQNSPMHQSQDSSNSTTPTASSPSSASSSGDTGTNSKSSGSDTTTIMVPMVVLMPFQFHTDQNLANGCWVRMFDSTNFKGKDEITIAGPIEMQSLKTPSGINWRRKADSLVVGPKATVSVYEDELFKDKNLTFKPGQQVPSLRKELGFMHSIDSLKISCTS
jgi:hypothetical protein